MFIPCLLLLVAALVFATRIAADQIEAVGAQRCGGRVRSFSVQFLAPENAALVAIARERLGDGPRMSLSRDGRACGSEECRFEAGKGHTYTFLARSDDLAVPQDLCISVVRP
jgi:hypothetical protein